MTQVAARTTSTPRWALALCLLLSVAQFGCPSADLLGEGAGDASAVGSDTGVPSDIAIDRGGGGLDATDVLVTDTTTTSPPTDTGGVSDTSTVDTLTGSDTGAVDTAQVDTSPTDTTLADTTGDDLFDTGGATDIVIEPGPREGESCTQDSDCEGISCVLELDGVEYVSVCRTGLGGNRGPGERCTAAAQCASNACFLDTFCLGACTIGEGDCVGSATCRELDLVIDDNDTFNDLGDDTTATVEACVPNNLGSFSRCLTEADCTDEVCDIYLATNATERRCETPGVGIVEDGTCDTLSDCRNGSCLSPGFCLWPCQSDTDCNGDNECVDLPFDVDLSIPVCMAPCAHAGDCGDGATCLPVVDYGTPNQLATACFTAHPTATGASGADCTDGNDCRSTLCVEGLCSEICEPVTNNGCAVGATCYSFGFLEQYVSVDDKGTPDFNDDDVAAFPTCRPTVGTFAQCGGYEGADTWDCGGAEVCAPLPNETLTEYFGHCITPVGAGIGGASCLNMDTPDDSMCESDFCLASGTCLGSCADGCADGHQTCVILTITNSSDETLFVFDGEGACEP